MKEVFSLKDGQVGSALNHDHTIAYVIRIVEHQPPINELRTAYLGEANNWPGLMSETQRHAAELAQGLASDLTTGTNLKWEREADKIERPGDDRRAGAVRWETRERGLRSGWGVGNAEGTVSSFPRMRESQC